MQFLDDLLEVTALTLRPAATLGTRWHLGPTIYKGTSSSEMCVLSPHPLQACPGSTGHVAGSQCSKLTAQRSVLADKRGCKFAFEKLISVPAWGSCKSKVVHIYSRVQMESLWDSPQHLKILYGNQENFIWRQEMGRNNRPAFHLLLI